MFGAEIDGPTNTFCNNQSVVFNVTKTESNLQRKQNEISYYLVKECVAMGEICLGGLMSRDNLSDILTKILNGSVLLELSRIIFY